MRRSCKYENNFPYNIIEDLNNDKKRKEKEYLFEQSELIEAFNVMILNLQKTLNTYYLSFEENLISLINFFPKQNSCSYLNDHKIIVEHNKDILFDGINENFILGEWEYESYLIKLNIIFFFFSHCFILQYFH